MTEEVAGVMEFEGGFETSFTAGGNVDSTFPLTTPLDKGGSRMRCSFGAILTSVFEVRSRALPFGGSRLAVTPLSRRKTETSGVALLTHSKSNAGSA